MRWFQKTIIKNIVSKERGVAKLKRGILLGVVCIALGTFHPVHASVVDIQHSVLNQVESTLSGRNEVGVQPFTILPSKTEDETVPQQATNQQTFYIQRIELHHLPPQLSFLQALVDKKTNRSYGITEINRLLEEVNGTLRDKGYVTSKVYIEPQNLSSGTLTLSLLVGKVSNIRFTGTAGNYGNALAFHTGDILNIRRIEQTVDNLNAVLHQKVTVSLEPGENIGDTDVVFHVDAGSRFEVQTGIDNFGNEGTGRVQASGSISIAKPLNRSDNLYYSYTKALPSDHSKDSHSSYFSYQIPVGLDAFNFSHAFSDYEQTISYAIHPFISSGNFTTDAFSWEHVFHRNSKVKTEVISTISHKTRHSFINGNEIDVQKRRTTTLELALHQTRYITSGLLDLQLGYMRGMHWWSEPGPADALGDATTYYNLYVGRVRLDKEFTFNANYKGTYRLELKGQYSPNRLYASEFFNLGGWYAVRGFSGDNNLSAENGFYIRNTVELPTSPINKVYLGVDYGKVSGHYSSELLGQELAGAVIGVKGNYQHIYYNVFGAYPLSKPDGFRVPNKLFGFQLNMTI